MLSDYDDIGRDFFLVGGIHDPLSLRYEVIIRDDNGVEHKSAERYYWYLVESHPFILKGRHWCLGTRWLRPSKTRRQ